MLAQPGDHLTFDVCQMRAIRYSNTVVADERLEEDLRRGIDALGFTAEYGRVTSRHVGPECSITRRQT
jgi:hypothetical protein